LGHGAHIGVDVNRQRASHDVSRGITERHEVAHHVNLCVSRRVRLDDVSEIAHVTGSWVQGVRHVGRVVVIADGGVRREVAELVNNDGQVRTGRKPRHRARDAHNARLLRHAAEDERARRGHQRAGHILGGAQHRDGSVVARNITDAAHVRSSVLIGRGDQAHDALRHARTGVTGGEQRVAVVRAAVQHQAAPDNRFHRVGPQLELARGDRERHAHGARRVGRHVAQVADVADGSLSGASVRHVERVVVRAEDGSVRDVREVAPLVHVEAVGLRLSGQARQGHDDGDICALCGLREGHVALHAAERASRGTNKARGGITGRLRVHSVQCGGGQQSQQQHCAPGDSCTRHGGRV